MCTDKVLVVDHLKHTIFTLRKDVAVGLAIHSLWSESSSNQVHLLACELLLHALGELKALDLNESVFLWADTFSL